MPDPTDPPAADSPTNSTPAPPTRQELICYAVGNSANGLAAGTINSLQYPIFNMLLGLNPGWIGTVAAVARLYDAFTDPLMGHLSDNTRTRWGRRRPYLVLGGILIALVISVFFHVQAEWSASRILFWYLGGCLAFYTCTTIFMVPYYAMGIELAQEYNQRTRVVAYRSVVEKLTGIGQNWYFRFTECFANALTGARLLGGIVAVLGVTAAITTAVTVKERQYGKVASRPRSKESLWRSISYVLANKVYLRLLFIWVVMTLNMGVFQALGSYLNVYYVYGGDKAAGATLGGVVGTLGLVLSLLAIPFTKLLCDRLGKHVALTIALLLYIVGSILKWWLINPQYPWLQLGLPFFFSIGISSIYIVMATMQADIVDLDELQHGGRREGMFSAVGGWVMKLGGALAIGLAGWVLNWTGFDVRLSGEQAPGVFTNMRICFSFIPAGGCILALLMIRHYPLTREKVAEIKAQLLARRA